MYYNRPNRPGAIRVSAPSQRPISNKQVMLPYTFVHSSKIFPVCLSLVDKSGGIPGWRSSFLGGAIGLEVAQDKLELSLVTNSETLCGIPGWRSSFLGGAIGLEVAQDKLELSLVTNSETLCGIPGRRSSFLGGAIGLSCTRQTRIISDDNI